MQPILFLIQALNLRPCIRVMIPKSLESNGLGTENREGVSESIGPGNPGESKDLLSMEKFRSIILVVSGEDDLLRHVVALIERLVREFLL
jgi:hypothetical protein